MPFRFPLDSLLRLRCSLEHQHELLLQAANSQLAEIRHKIESAERIAHLSRERREQQMSVGTAAAQVHFALICESVLQEYQRALALDRAKAEELCAHRAEAYRSARRDREILDTLNEDQLHRYVQNQNRRQQRELDNLLLLLHQRRRHG